MYCTLCGRLISNMPVCVRCHLLYSNFCALPRFCNGSSAVLAHFSRSHQHLRLHLCFHAASFYSLWRHKTCFSPLSYVYVWILILCFDGFLYWMLLFSFCQLLERAMQMQFTFNFIIVVFFFPNTEWRPKCLRNTQMKILMNFLFLTHSHWLFFCVVVLFLFFSLVPWFSVLLQIFLIHWLQHDLQFGVYILIK